MDSLIKKLSLLTSYRTHSTPAVDDINELIDSVLQSKEVARKSSRRFSPGGSVCSRFKAFERLNNFEPKMATVDAASLRLFESGNTIHKTVQQNLLARTGKLFGSWRCRSCHKQIHNSTYPKHICTSSITVTDTLSGETTTTRCADVVHRDENAWVYVERYMYTNPLQDDSYAITGFVDGIWVDKLWYVLEVKSVTSEAFNAVYTTKHPEQSAWRIIKPTTPRLPVASHIYQGHVYGKILLDQSMSGELPLNANLFGGLLLLYVDRATFAIKVFHEPYTPSAYDQLLAQAIAAKQAVDSNNFMLAPPKCTNATNVLATRCPLQYTCFPKK